jgi:hypothetical protein
LRFHIEAIYEMLRAQLAARNDAMAMLKRDMDARDAGKFG